MNVLTLALRLIHILSGVLWVGTALLNTFFLGPTVAATGEAGQKFMAHLVSKARLSARVTLASYLTVIAGAILYWIDSQGFTSGWLTSGAGIGFALGGIAGLIGFGAGQIVGKNATLIGKIASEVRGAPTPQQAAALQQAGAKMTSMGRISSAFLIASLACMATARYWLF